MQGFGVGRRVSKGSRDGGAGCVDEAFFQSPLLLARHIAALEFEFPQHARHDNVRGVMSSRSSSKKNRLSSMGSAAQRRAWFAHLVLALIVSRAVEFGVVLAMCFWGSVLAVAPADAANAALAGPILAVVVWVVAALPNRALCPRLIAGFRPIDDGIGLVTVAEQACRAAVVVPDILEIP